MNLSISPKTKIYVIILTLSFLSACGGGNDSNKASKKDAYQGITSQTIITPENINEFDPKSYSELINFKTHNIFSDLSNLIYLLSLYSNSNPSSNQLKNCQQSGTQNIKLNKTTNYTTSLSFKYNNCKDSVGETANGIADISLIKDPITNDTTIDIILNNLSIKSITKDTLNNGSISLTDSNVRTIKSSMVTEDKILKITTKTQDALMTIKQETDQQSATFTTKYYQSDIGYVTLEITKPIVISTRDVYPNSGELLITGASNRNGYNSTIRIIYLNVDNYQVLVDFDSSGDASDQAEIDTICPSVGECTL